ncbi:MAG TPA: hypothetical protein DCL29_02070 [Eubacterium sp.]|nr:hypothetical protein [Eubacterium sp.]
MRNKLRKKYQKRVNKLIKEVNKSIKEDPLWNGRFVFHIMDSYFERFEDGSGGLLYVVVRGYDKKDEYHKDYTLEYIPYLRLGAKYDIWQIANNFITKDTDT